MVPGMRALNVEVPRDLVERWVEWFAPVEQPFLVDPGLAASLGLRVDGGLVPAALRDTFEIYGTPRGIGCAWLSEAEFFSLPRSERARWSVLSGRSRGCSRRQVVGRGVGRQGAWAG
jgi:hypothetical protein